ncbi:hypothetical protein R5R35_000486 [Gryllus longicercus]|uniref:Uncharacterized protein n=1 Tax=Gryllus longicercus TaxID=2509291 RepID=A0AAN9VMS4_9ORTH
MDGRKDRERGRGGVESANGQGKPRRGKAMRAQRRVQLAGPGAALARAARPAQRGESGSAGRERAQLPTRAGNEITPRSQTGRATPTGPASAVGDADRALIPFPSRPFSPAFARGLPEKGKRGGWSSRN